MNIENELHKAFLNINPNLGYNKENIIISIIVINVEIVIIIRIILIIRCAM
jgi:hypothetical protein